MESKPLQSFGLTRPTGKDPFIVARRLLAVLCALIVTTGLAASPSQPAFAGGGVPACGAPCDFKNPYIYRYDPNHNLPDDEIDCSLAYSTHGTATTGTVSLTQRYSTYCETTWAEWTKGDFGVFRIWLESNYLDGTPRVREFLGDVVEVFSRSDGFTGYSVMINDHNLLNRLCVFAYNSPEDKAKGWAYDVQCTSWY